MSSLFSHIFIPIVILLILSNRLKLDPRKIVLLSPFGILPDADIFLFHRASLHNIFILFIPLLAFIFIKNRRDIFGIICFYLMSHIILDIFNGGIYILYPFYEKVFFIHTEIIFNYNNIIPIIDYGIGNDIMNNGISEPMISSENIGISILLIISALIQNRYNARKKCGNPYEGYVQK